MVHTGWSLCSGWVCSQPEEPCWDQHKAATCVAAVAKHQALELSFKDLDCFHPKYPSCSNSCSLGGQLWAGGTPEGKAVALLRGAWLMEILEAHSLECLPPVPKPLGTSTSEVWRRAARGGEKKGEWLRNKPQESPNERTSLPYIYFPDPPSTSTPTRLHPWPPAGLSSASKSTSKAERRSSWQRTPAVAEASL